MIKEILQQPESSNSSGLCSSSLFSSSETEQQDEIEQSPSPSPSPKPRRSGRKGKSSDKPAEVIGRPPHKKRGKGKKKQDANKIDKSDKLPMESEEEEMSSKEDAMDIDLADQQPVESGKEEPSAEEDRTSGEDDTVHAMVIDLPEEQPVESEKEDTSDEEDTTDAVDLDLAGKNTALTLADGHSALATFQITSSTLPTIQSAASFKTEAMEIIKHGGITSSGMSSSEASKLLAAFLSLEQNERKAVLDLSHDDIVAEFQKIAKANKEELKRREVQYATSPKCKRLCQRI